MPDIRPSPSPRALARYQVISAYLALDPPRGQREALRKKLADKEWTDEHGAPMRVTAETIRAWVRRYRKHGLEGLEDRPRPRPGGMVLSEATVALACAMKKEVPARSIDRIIKMLEALGHVRPGLVRRSTLHRALRRHGLSGRRARIPDTQDLDRFEALSPNDLWQSDMLQGPWLPDPDRPGKMRRAWLYTFLDDHSRYILYGRFSFKGDQPALELVFRRAVQKCGLCRRVYYDNGATYRSHHMRQVVAELGIDGIAFTRPGRPEGHGKIEALNRLIIAAFIEEVRASSITTLDALNEAWLAWVELDYNRAVHGETGETPRDRWRKELCKLRFAEEDKVRRAFLWTEERRSDKTGLFSLFGTRYQVGPTLARKKVTVRYDPENLDELEIWFEGRFVERVRPFEVRQHRRAKAATVPQAEPADKPAAPVAPWLDHLVQRHRREGFIAPSPRAEAERTRAERDALDRAVLALLQDRLDPAVVDGPIVRDFLDRHGPFDPDRAAAVLDRILASQPRDLHVTHYLEAIRREILGDPE